MNKMKRTGVFIVAVTILFISNIATAQPQVAQSTKKPLKLTESVNKRYGAFNVDFEYYQEDAWAGNSNLEVKITTTTDHEENLKLIKFEFDDSTQSIIEKINELGQNSSNEGLRRTQYRYAFSIKKEAIPQPYYIKLRFEPPEKDSHPNDIEYTDILITFTLSIGVRSSGLLKVFNDSSIEGDPLVCTTGGHQSVFVPIVNNYPRYPAYIEAIQVTSEPPGLIQSIVDFEALWPC